MVPFAIASHYNILDTLFYFIPQKNSLLCNEACLYKLARIFPPHYVYENIQQLQKHLINGVFVFDVKIPTSAVKFLA